MQEEIYKTKEALITLNVDSGSFHLCFQGEYIQFKLCDLYTFKTRIMDLDIMRLLDADSPDLELIHLPHCDRILLLNVHQVLQFRELLNSTFDILTLNSSIHKILRRNVFNF